ncbi:GtrA family protein [Patescibacteria group bacterium]|nr:GtrA family protein [Patescibacteria group bacterium]
MFKKLEQKYKTLFQIVKFALVGGLNTALDFAVLNALIWATGTSSGKWIILFNSLAFTAAVINSYILNKIWTFQSKEKKVASQFARFITVSLIGWVVNTAIVFTVTTYIDPYFGLNETLWANVAKIVATGVALVWNFIGYKLWAFRDKDQETEVS